MEQKCCIIHGDLLYSPSNYESQVTKRIPKPTMTLNELNRAFHEFGIGCGLETLVQGIRQGVSPFAVAIKCSGEYVYFIWRKKVEEYLKECIGPLD